MRGGWVLFLGLMSHGAGADSYVGPDATPAEVAALAGCTAVTEVADWAECRGIVYDLCAPTEDPVRVAQCLAREDGAWDVFITFDLMPRLAALAEARDAREVLDVNGLTGLAEQVAAWGQSEWPAARCRIAAFAADASDLSDTFGVDRVAQFECYVDARVARAMQAAQWIATFEEEAAR